MGGGVNLDDNKTILKVEGLKKVYQVKKGDPINAVNGISFEVKSGEILGLLGPNGAGKTTTVKMICGLIRPNEGRVLIDDVDNMKHRTKALKKLSAVLEGNRNIYWRLTVRENLEFFASIKGVNPKKISNEIDYYIDLFDLKEKEKETARKLSRGMQQKLAIAVAMVSQSQIILLDEPTLGLDVKASYEIRELLKKIAKEDGRTIILTTHDMNVVQDVCDQVIIVNNGKVIAQDNIENLFKLFQVKAYEFKIKGKLTDEQKEGLRKIPYLKVEEKEFEAVLSLNMDDYNVLYEVIDILKQDNSVIEAINRKEINFERVFMEIIGRSEESDSENPAI